MDNFLKYLFPEKCIICEHLGRVLCNSCFEMCTKINSHYSLCFKEGCIDVYSPLSYEGVARECLRRSKFFSKEFRVLKLLTELCLIEFAFPFKDCIVVSIPSSPEKLKKRGFNQAYVISSMLAKKYHLKEQSSILTRKKITHAQYNLTKSDRLENLKYAFGVVPFKRKSLRGKKILLVDDLCTSGATLVCAANALYRYGAKEVMCFTLMRQIRRSKIKLENESIVQHEYF